MINLLITGKDSYIGTQVEHYLSQFTGAYRVDTLDMLDANWRSQNLSQYDSVFHVAGIAHSDSGKISPEKASLYYYVNTELTVETARLAKNAGVKHFIFMSSMIVYGESAPIGQTKHITAKTKPNPTNAYGDSKLQAEIGLTQLADVDFNICILRPPMIYGKGCKGNYPTLSKMAQKLPFFPDIKNERSMLYIEHLCNAVKQIIDRRLAGVYFPQNAEYFSTTEMIRIIAETHGRSILTTRLFNPLIRALGKKIGLITKAYGNLTYDQSLSAMPEPYNIYTLRQTLEKTEQRLAR